MKKCLAIAFLILFLHPIFAAGIEPFWQIGNIYAGGDVSKDGGAFTAAGDLLNLGVSFYPDVTERKFTLKVSPFGLSSAFAETDTECELGIEKNDRSTAFRPLMPSFLNVNFSYNFLDSQNLELSPFVGAKYFFLSGFDNYLFETGIEFSLYTSDIVLFPSERFPMKTKIVSLRLGGRCLNGEFSAFAEVGIDLGILVYCLVSNEYKDAVEIHEGRGKPKR